MPKKQAKELALTCLVYYYFTSHQLVGADAPVWNFARALYSEQINRSLASKARALGDANQKTRGGP